MYDVVYYALVLCIVRVYSRTHSTYYVLCILLHRYCWSTSAGPGKSPSRQGTSDGRRAERASEDTNETKNNVMEMAAYIAMHSRYSSTVCIHVVYHDGDSECKCVTARRRRRKIETERYFFI